MEWGCNSGTNVKHRGLRAQETHKTLIQLRKYTFSSISRATTGVHVARARMHRGVRGAGCLHRLRCVHAAYVRGVRATLSVR